MNDKIKLLNELKIDRESPAPKSAKGKVAIALALILSGGVGYYLSGNDQQVTADNVMTVSNKAEPVKTFPAEPKLQPVSHQTAVYQSQAKSILEASGYVTAQRVATVSAKTIGLINEVFVEEGDYVEKGQALARLDDKIAALNLSIAKSKSDLYTAEISKREAELVEAKRNLNRVTDLKDKNFAHQSEIDALTSQIQVLEANLSSAHTNYKLNMLDVERLQQHLDDHIIKAPFSGVVTVKNAQPGEIISPSSAGGGYTRTGICTIVDTNSLEIEVDVNETFLNKVQIGQDIEASVLAYQDMTFKGSVKNISSTVDKTKATVRVRIAIHDKSDLILPNMAVRVNFVESVTKQLRG